MEMLPLVGILAIVGVATPFPRDLQPINTVGAEESRLFPIFRGLMWDGDAERLSLDFQHMIQIRDVLYIAGREHVFAVNLSTSTEQIIPQKTLTWKAKDVSKCRVRGRNRDECYNYIKVLVQRNDDTLFVCGTNAFSPVCRNYRLWSLQQVGSELAGQARCPFASQQANLALFAGGHFYSATVWDVQASDAVLYRSLGGEGSPSLRTVKYDSKWLREPRFLRAIEYGNYVYFFFSEISVECTALGKVVYSRVARVCKNDHGGSQRVLDGYWTSFLKARLNCSVPGQSFFYFDVLQSVTGVLQINRRPAVLAVFTTQNNSIPGSAVCGFYMDEMERVFQGRFKEHRGGDSGWTAVPEDQVPKPRPGSCAGEGPASSYSSSVMFPDVMLSFIKAHPLMEESVSSITSQPFLTHTSHSFKLTEIEVDGAAGPNRNRTVVFLGSDDGHVLKVMMSLHPNSSTISTLLEQIHVYNAATCNGSSRVLGLELDKQHHALYVAFSSCVIRVPLSRCTRHRTCRSCLSSRDPYCIWRETECCSDLESNLKGGYKEDLDGKHSYVPDICSDIVSSAGKHNLVLESTTAVKGISHRDSLVIRLHYTLLIVCVLVAFVSGVFLSLILMWCHCGQTAKQEHHGKKGGATLPQALRDGPNGPYKLGRLPDMLGNQTSVQGYCSVPSRAEQQGASTIHTVDTTTRTCSQDEQLCSLPSPDPTPHLPVKHSNIYHQENTTNSSRATTEGQVLPQSQLTPSAQSSSQSAAKDQCSDRSDVFFNKQLTPFVFSGNHSPAPTLCTNQSRVVGLVPGEQACHGLTSKTLMKHLYDKVGEEGVSGGFSTTVSESAWLSEATGCHGSGSVLLQENSSHGNGAAAEGLVSLSNACVQWEIDGQKVSQWECPVSWSTHRLSLMKKGSRVTMRQHSFKQQGSLHHGLGQGGSGGKSAPDKGADLGHELNLYIVPRALCLIRHHSYSELEHCCEHLANSLHHASAAP